MLNRAWLATLAALTIVPQIAFSAENMPGRINISVPRNEITTGRGNMD